MTRNGKPVTQGQADVYDVLAQYGPLADHALVPLAQHMLAVHQSSSGIRTRRRELQNIGLVQCVDTVKTGSGRLALVFEAVK
jgi:hypothetical protein